MHATDVRFSIQGINMKLKTIAASLVATLGLVATAANADAVSVNGGTVHFKGELVNAACAVSTASSNQTVELGQYRMTVIRPLQPLPLLPLPARSMPRTKPCWRSLPVITVLPQAA